VSRYMPLDARLSHSISSSISPTLMPLYDAKNLISPSSAEVMS